MTFVIKYKFTFVYNCNIKNQKNKKNEKNKYFFSYYVFIGFFVRN